MARSAAGLVSELSRTTLVSLTRGFAEPATLPLRLLETVCNAALLIGGGLLSAAQTLLHLEPPGRALSDAERTAAQQVFGDAIDLSRVRIKQGFAGLGSVNSRPFAFGDTIYLKHDSSLRTVIHELVHVWQKQHGPVPLFSSLVAQRSDQAYDWRRGVAEGSPWRTLNPEQQARLIEEAYVTGRLMDSPRDDGGPGSDDHPRYVSDALRELRAGRGAGAPPR